MRSILFKSLMRYVLLSYELHARVHGSMQLAWGVVLAVVTVEALVPVAVR